MAQENVLNHYTRHAVYVERYGQTVALELLAEIAFVDERVLGILAALPADPTNAQVTEALTRASSIIRVEYETAVAAQLDSSLRAFVAPELEWNREAVEIFAGEVIAVATPTQVYVAATSKPYEGRTMRQWAISLGEDKIGRVENAVLTGYLNGATNAEISSEIRDAIGVSNQHAKTIARTSVQHIANEARNVTLSENEDVVEVIEWTSTLDARTTTICAVRDGKLYTTNGTPIGHTYDYLGGPGRAHWNCRSTSVPYFSDDDIEGRRPAVSAGENYERGDNLTNRGTVRKPTKRNRDKGIFKGELVNSSTKYEAWLRRQPKAFVEDVLGVTKGRAFREGAPLSTFVDRFGSPLTLRELRERNALGFIE